jgi:hypothetical protein
LNQVVKIIQLSRQAVGKTASIRQIKVRMQARTTSTMAFTSCTPAIRASSVSKCEMARSVGSFAERNANARLKSANNSGSS